MLGELDLSGPHLAISGATGAESITSAERAALEQAGHTSRGFTSLTGHLKEAQFPFAVALAALAVSHGTAPSPIDGSEAAFTGGLDMAIATSFGYRRYGGVAAVGRA
jgi:3-oxoacyl-[acyl-carrier-protein] synthase II